MADAHYSDTLVLLGEMMGVVVWRECVRVRLNPPSATG